MDGHRTVARGGRRLLVDRAERDRARTRALRARGDDLGTTADELAFDRSPGEYRCAPLVQLRRVDWAHTIARHWLYETADELRLARLKESDDPEVAGLAAKMDREEVYHRLHAHMWADHLRDEPRFRSAVEELWPYAVGVVDEDLRPALAQCWTSPVTLADRRTRRRLGRVPRRCWDEMTMVRRSVPGATW